MGVKKIVSIVVPAYNEEGSIKQALEELKKVNFKQLGFGREIIVVNDGSRDKTGEIIKSIKGIRAISYSQNRGKGFAIRKGFKEAKGEIIAIQDADLEYNPANIVGLLKELLRGREVVYGSRFLGKPKNMSFTFYFGNRVVSAATSIIFGQRITDMETCQKVFKRSLLKKFSLKANGFDIEPELTGKFIRAGVKILEVPIPYTAREKAEKKINVTDGIKAVLTLLKVRLVG